MATTIGLQVNRDHINLVSKCDLLQVSHQGDHAGL